MTMVSSLRTSHKAAKSHNQIGLPPWRTNKKTFSKKKFLQSNSINDGMDAPNIYLTNFLNFEMRVKLLGLCSDSNLIYP